MEIKLKEDERIDDLELKNMKIIQNKNGFCFGMDSILLSDFAKEIKNSARVVDLGTGTGIIGILLCAKTGLSEVVGIEIQKEVANMARRSIGLNHLEKRFKIVNRNIKQIIYKRPNKEIKIKQISKNKKSYKLIDKINLNKESFDYVVTNPPYKKMNTGMINENEKKLISRHEYTANLSDFIKTTKYLLKDKGTLFMVHRPERLVDIIEIMRKEKIEPKQIKFIYPKMNTEPNLVLIKGVKNARPFLKIEKPLYVYKEDGKYTDEILTIYQKSERKDM